MGSHGTHQQTTATTTTTTSSIITTAHDGESHYTARAITASTSAIPAANTTATNTPPTDDEDGKTATNYTMNNVLSSFSSISILRGEVSKKKTTSTTTIYNVASNTATPPSFRMQTTSTNQNNNDSENNNNHITNIQRRRRRRGIINADATTTNTTTDTSGIIAEEERITAEMTTHGDDTSLSSTPRQNQRIPSSSNTTTMVRTMSATDSNNHSAVRDWTHYLDVHAKTLDLSSHSIRTEHLYGLVQTLLEQCVELEAIDLSSNHLGSKGMEKLQTLLATHPTLKQVRLARNALKGRRALRYLWEACHANDRLRHLDLSHNQLSDAVVSKDLAPLLDSRHVACRLETLDLSNNGARLTETSAWELGGALVSGHNTTLKTLKLSGNALGPVGGEALGTLLKLSHTLEALHVANCNLGDKGVQYICQGLLMAESEPALRILDVAWNVLHDDAAGELADVIENNSTLERIQLECNGIGDKGAAFLAHALPRNESLQVLDLRGNQIHDAGAIALAVALTNARCQDLELHWEMNAHMTPVGRHRIEGALQLRVNRRQWLNALLQNLQGVRRYPPLNYEVGDDEVVDICKHVATQQLQHAVTLPVVRFRGSGITLRGVKAIANQLLCPVSVTLTHLYFMHTRMGDDGANLLAQALLRNQSLTTLTCIDCQWTDEGALYLSRALPRHRYLQRLDLRDNRIGTEGARAVLHAITEEAPNIHTLYLGKNQIGDMAVRSLTSIGHLVTLNLADNLLTDAAALDLARICGNIPTPGNTNGHSHEIKWLNVSRNYLTERGKQALDLFLPCLSTLDTSDQRF